MNNTERIAEIRAIEQAATPGPWELDDFGFLYSMNEERISSKIGEINGSNYCANATFIAHTREDIPYLLSEVERLTKGIKDTGKECARRYDEIQRLTAELEQKTRELERFREEYTKLNQFETTQSAKLLQRCGELDHKLERYRELERAYQTDDWNEDDGDVLWWKLPVDEPPYVGSPLCEDWPGYHTYWTRLPDKLVVNDIVYWLNRAALSAEGVSG